jgi:RHS repeat-associated protein
LCRKVSEGPFGDFRTENHPGGEGCTSESLTCQAPYTFTGHLYDQETGLFYFGARYYDPETGRFLSQDPVAGDALNPPSLHKYLYAYSSPMNYTDPWGEVTTDDDLEYRKQMQEEMAKRRANMPMSTGEELFVPPGPIAQQMGQARGEWSSPAAKGWERQAYGALWGFSVPARVLEEGIRGFANLPYLVVHGSSHGGTTLGEGIIERDPYKIYEGSMELYTVFTETLAAATPASSDMKALSKPGGIAPRMLKPEEGLVGVTNPKVKIRAPEEPVAGPPEIAPNAPKVAPQKSITDIQPSPSGAADSALPRSRLQAGRGDQSAFAKKAETLVSEHTGVPRNPQGPGQQTIPGTGPGGFRVPDLKVRGHQGSFRLRGTVIEVKASRGSTFGELSQRSRQQRVDAVTYARRLRARAEMVKDPQVRAVLENAHVEVFSDVAAPVRGKYADLIEEGLIEWKAIPR